MISRSRVAHRLAGAPTPLAGLALGLASLGWCSENLGGFDGRAQLVGAVLALGLLAVLFAKFLNLFLKEKINPMVGAAGISAFPMSSRVVQKLALSENPQNILIMHAAGANVSGQIASAIAGGLMITLVSAYL